MTCSCAPTTGRGCGSSSARAGAVATVGVPAVPARIMTSVEQRAAGGLVGGVAPPNWAVSSLSTEKLNDLAATHEALIVCDAVPPLQLDVRDKEAGAHCALNARVLSTPITSMVGQYDSRPSSVSASKEG